jgi:hypothetical protein
VLWWEWREVGMEEDVVVGVVGVWGAMTALWNAFARLVVLSFSPPESSSSSS